VINLSSVKGLVVLGKTLVVAHRSELLLGASITSTIGAVVLAAKGGYEARGIVDQAEYEEKRELTTQEKANLTWHCYWPAAAASLTAVGSTAGLHIVHVKEKKQLAAAALMTIDEIKRDAQKVIDEKVGPLDKSQQEGVLEEKAKKNKDGKAVVKHGDGVVDELYLCREGWTGREFWGNKAKIDAAVNEVNRLINARGDCDLNTFYNWVGVEETDRGLELGWSGVVVGIEWDDDHRKDDGRPVRVFRFQPEPSKGYDDPHA